MKLSAFVYRLSVATAVITSASALPAMAQTPNFSDVTGTNVAGPNFSDVSGTNVAGKNSTDGSNDSDSSASGRATFTQAAAQQLADDIGATFSACGGGACPALTPLLDQAASVLAQ